jgi:hypothetical protein
VVGSIVELYHAPELANATLDESEAEPRAVRAGDERIEESRRHGFVDHGALILALENDVVVVSRES